MWTHTGWNEPAIFLQMDTLKTFTDTLSFLLRLLCYLSFRNTKVSLDKSPLLWDLSQKYFSKNLSPFTPSPADSPVCVHSADTVVPLPIAKPRLLFRPGSTDSPEVARPPRVGISC